MFFIQLVLPLNLIFYYGKYLIQAVTKFISMTTGDGLSNPKGFETLAFS